MIYLQLNSYVARPPWGRERARPRGFPEWTNGLASERLPFRMRLYRSRLWAPSIMSRIRFKPRSQAISGSVSTSPACDSRSAQLPQSRSMLPEVVPATTGTSAMRVVASLSIGPAHLDSPAVGLTAFDLG